MFLIAFCVKGEEFPTAVEQAEEFIIGWNIGNSLERVKEVVDYCLENDMFVMINSHHCDGGWMEGNPNYYIQEEVNEKNEAYWTQIAKFFTDYDSRLIFAGTNEVREDYGVHSAENIEVQESDNQTGTRLCFL